MQHRRWLVRLGGAAAVITVVGMVIPAASVAAPAPPTPDRLALGEHLEQLASHGKNYLRRLRPEVVERMSSGAQQLLKLAQEPDETEELAAAAKRTSLAAPTVRAQGPRAAKAGLANDTFAAEDFYSRLSGMTQSETTVGWCGTNALIGFNDSGSFISSAFLALSPSGSLSFNGWSQSTDAGRTYTDRGGLIADPIPDKLMFRDLLGDPVIGCADRNTFYFASLAMDTAADLQSAATDITVSASHDGGTTFSSAVPAASKDANLHFLDKPWLSVSPGPTASASDDILGVTYTDFDFSGFEGQGPCPDQVRSAIEYVQSSDGGQTWSRPVVLDEVCDPNGSVQGSQVEITAAGDIYAAWERFPFSSGDLRDIRIRRSTDGGATFTPVTVVTPVTPIGDSGVNQGFFRTALDLQGLAVDQSRTSRKGTVYLTFQDGSARQKPDPLGFCLGAPVYCFGDVYLTSSADHGATWATPVRVNDDDPRLGIDQWFPALDVDRSGNVWTAFYDRRRDERNFLIDTFVAKSTNGGATLTNVRATNNLFPPITGWQDFVVNPAYMGDYIAVAADSTGRYPGVIAAWGDNSLGDANVAQRKFEG
jgi:hypothetical protein